PRACNSAPSAADARPLPSEETTPPVMKTYRAMGPNLLLLGLDSTSLQRTKSRRGRVNRPLPVETLLRLRRLRFRRSGRCAGWRTLTQAVEHAAGRERGVSARSRGLRGRRRRAAAAVLQ